MKKIQQFTRACSALMMTFFAGSLPAYASGLTGGGSQSQIAADAQQIIDVLDGFGLPYIQAGVSVFIAIIVIVGAVKASRAKNTSLLWTEIGFGLFGIILVLNPLLLINAFLKISGWFGGSSS